SRCGTALRAQAHRESRAGTRRCTHPAAPGRGERCACAPVAGSAPSTVQDRHGGPRSQGGAQEPRRALWGWPGQDPSRFGVSAVTHLIVDDPEQGIKRITLNRPQQLNAFTFEMYAQLIEV